MWTFTRPNTPQESKSLQSLVPKVSMCKLWEVFLVLTDPTSGNIFLGDHLPDITNIGIKRGQRFSCSNLAGAENVRNDLPLCGY